MRFNSVLTSSFFASAVVVESQVFNPWAGRTFALDLGGPGTIQYVSGTFNVPDISHSGIGTSAFAFVGIDGTSSCPSALHLGVKLATINHGHWHWYSVAYRYGEEDWMKIFFNATDVPISTNDTIKLTVNAPVGGKLGIVKAENLSNNKSHNHTITLPTTLCGKAALWIVEEYEYPSNNFGPFTFFNTQVGGNDFGSPQWNVTNIDVDRRLVTKVDVVDDSFTITW